MKQLIVLLPFLFIFACSESEKNKVEETKYSFSFTGHDFGMHDGDHFNWRLIDRFTKAKVGEGDFTLSGSEIEISAGAVLRENVWYDFVFFSDVNRNSECDSPPTDHTWRISIEPVTSNVAIEQEHLMIFSEVCDDFDDNASPIQTELVTITGSLKLETGVSLDGVNSDGVSQAQIFAAGFPSQESFSEKNGSFTLSLNIPVDQGLLPENLNILMWYTERNQDSNSAWEIPSKRVGAARAVEVSDRIELGSVAMTYTKGIRIPVQSSLDDSNIENCWVRIESLGSQTVGLYNKDRGLYEISYLPPGQYEVKFFCMGYQDQSQIYEVGEATDFSQWENQDAIKMTPTN